MSRGGVVLGKGHLVACIHLFRKRIPTVPKISFNFDFDQTFVHHHDKEGKGGVCGCRLILEKK